jgi:hypothetical protein
MAQQLLVVEGVDKGQVFPLSPTVPVTIGRGRQVDARLNDLQVSRLHLPPCIRATGCWA